jgi:transposase
METGGTHLYMAALSALRQAGFLSDFVVRKKAVKPAKVILMAVARRLLVIANVILWSRIPFQPTPN